MDLQKGELQRAQKFIDEHLDRLVDWTIGDIKRCCRLLPNGTCELNGALVGSFMLWICVIDYWGGVYSNNANKGGTLSRFREFVPKYLPQYDYNKLYEMRWALVHFYSTRNFMFQQDNDIEKCKKLHLTASDKGIVLDLYCSIMDLDTAINKYKEDLARSDELKVKFLRYHETTGPLVPILVINQSYTNKPLGGGGTQQTHNSAGTATFPNY